jgi:hypothetical protein
MTVYVNRGETDWEVAGQVLPQYGYLAENDKLRSTIQRREGQIVEWSQSENVLYVNGRQVPVNPPLAIRPSIEQFEHLGGDRFRMQVAWDTREPAPKDLCTFIHFEQPVVSRHRKPEGFVGGGAYPEKPTSRWQGHETTAYRQYHLPEELPAGRYAVLVGLYDREGNKKRYHLLGPGRGDERYKIGTLIVERQGGEVSDIRVEKAEPVGPLYNRLLGNRKPTRFPGCETIGAFRLIHRNEKVSVLTPLPLEPAFGVTLFPNELKEQGGGEVEAITAIDAEGKTLEPVEVQRDGGAVRFLSRPEVFAYRIEWK